MEPRVNNSRRPVTAVHRSNPSDRTASGSSVISGLRALPFALCSTLSLCLFCASPVTSPAATAPPAATTDVLALAEEITVLRAVKGLRATPEQLAALSKAVGDAQARLSQQSAADLRALAALRGPITSARQQLLPETVDLNNPQLAAALMADQQVASTQRAAEQNQARLRDELAASLRKQIEALLTPAQGTVIVSQGRAMLVAQRAEQDRQMEQRRLQMQQAMRASGQTPGGPGAGGGRDGGRGGRGGGPGNEGPQRMMERLRGADSDEYQRMSRGIARRFGDEGTPGYQNALAMFDRIRSMPDGQFRRQRANLTQQFTTSMDAARSGANAAYTISDQNSADSWIRRYLLSPQAPAALQALAAVKTGD